MNRAEFSITIEFGDGVKVALGGADTFFVERTEDDKQSSELNDERLNLIRLIRDAEIEACE